MLAANSHCFHQKMFILVTGLQTGLPPEAHNKNESTLLDMSVRWDKWLHIYLAGDVTATRNKEWEQWLCLG